jgi:hypothetical protein
VASTVATVSCSVACFSGNASVGCCSSRFHCDTTSSNAPQTRLCLSKPCKLKQIHTIDALLSATTRRWRNCWSIWYHHRRLYRRVSHAGSGLFTLGEERFVIFFGAIGGWLLVVCSLTDFAVQKRLGFYRGRSNRMSECRRRVMVDGEAVARQESHRAVSVQFCRALARQLPTHEPIDESHARQQYTKSQEHAPEVQNVQKAL